MSTPLYKGPLVSWKDGETHRRGHLVMRKPADNFQLRNLWYDHENQSQDFIVCKENYHHDILVQDAFTGDLVFVFYHNLFPVPDRKE